jgi:hypothetical protein
VIRGRAGRARFATNPRATVYPAPPLDEKDKEEIVQLSRAINSPDDLVKICQRAGATVRPTKSGHFVQGPHGCARIPEQIDRGRALENCIAQLRRAGVDLSDAMPTQPAPKRATAGSPADLAKFFTNGGRPTLTFVKDDDEPDTAAKEDSMTAQPDTESEGEAAFVTQADLDTLLEMLDSVNRRLEGASQALDGLSSRLDRVERRLRKVENGDGQSNWDRTKEVREEILAWFRQLPAGMRLPSGAVCDNVCKNEEEREVYRRQISRLVELGQLQQHGTDRSGRGGAYYTYSLPESSAEKAN